MLTLNIKPDNEFEDVGKLYENHSLFHVGDAGFDLFCPERIVVNPGEKATINFLVSCELFEEPTIDESIQTTCNIELLRSYKSYLLVPRSSISKRPLIMVNSVGIIDAGYRGEIKAIVYNYSNALTEISPGERLFQLVPLSEKQITKVNIVSQLSTTARGIDGFGSTGK